MYGQDSFELLSASVLLLQSDYMKFVITSNLQCEGLARSMCVSLKCWSAVCGPLQILS